MKNKVMIINYFLLKVMIINDFLLKVSDLLPGFRFLPEDEELINNYLIPKIKGHDYPDRVIPEVDLCKVEPHQVPGLSIIKSKYQEWFFFSPVDYKYSNSKRVNRTTKCGFWKSTGKDRNITAKGTNDVIGTKKTLVYYEGRVPNGVKSNWVIHEYHAVTDFHQTQSGFVLCLLMNKAAEGGTDALMCDEGEPSSSGHMTSSDHENIATEEENPPVGALPEMHQEEIDLPPVHLSTIGIELEARSSNHSAYFKNEDNIMQTPFETIEEGNEFPTSISTPIHQSIYQSADEQETSLTTFRAHYAYFKNHDKTIEEDNTSLLFPIEQSPIGIEQEASFTSFSAYNASFGYKRYSIQTPFETIEDENGFVTSIQKSPFQTIESVNKFSTSIQNSPCQTIKGGNEFPPSIQNSPCQTIKGGNEFPPSTQNSQFQTIEGWNEFPTSILTAIQESPTIEGGNEFTSILTSIQKSHINIELEASFKTFLAQNTCIRNEDCLMQTLVVVETTEEGNESLPSISAPRESEEEIELLNSFFANENFVPNKEIEQVFVNNSTQTESLKRAYYGSYDTDAEVASTQNGNVVDISAMCNEHSSSDEYRASKMLKSTHGSIGGGIRLFSSYQDANNEESILQNDFWGVDFWGVETSCDSTTDKPFESNGDEISS